MAKNFNKTILIVDDTETNIDILVELLNDYDIAVATSGESALQTAGQENIDLILLDIMMPVMDGYEVCRKLKLNDKTKDIPVIFITAKIDEDSIAQAYDSGGSDYISKPFKPRELLARVDTQLKLAELIRHLEFIASYDDMTGIYNRRKFFELASKKFEKNKDELFGVMIDIDNFKSINDSYGHHSGDKVIKLVTKKISEFISGDSVLGRLGGEEFAIICNMKSSQNISEIIEKIRYEIEKLEVISDAGEIIKFTISEGIAKYNTNMKNLDELLKKADEALYEAKGSGRNRVVLRS